MKLHDLVLLRNYLLGVSSVPMRNETDILDARLTAISNIIMHADYKISINKLIDALDKAEQELYKIENGLPDIINKIEVEINEKTTRFYKRGYQVNGLNGSDLTDVNTERNFRKLPITDETRSILVTKIKSCTDWHYPTLEIGPGDGEWTEHLVAADPLYIVDIHKEFLDSTLSRFNPIYRNRVRAYQIGSAVGSDEFNLGRLPNNQFGFIFSWNVFNYFPIYESRKMLEQCYQLLRPGGKMIFSFNDCDIPKCADYAEHGFRSWMPKKLLINVCKDLGFDIADYQSPEEVVAYLEIKKPGDLRTVKSHQVLGEIITRTA